MRFRAAAVLLVCLGWHIAMPLASLALESGQQHAAAVSTDRDPTPSFWVPQTSDARELVRPSERQGLRVACGRFRAERPKPPAVTGRKRERSGVYRSSYPARRWLHLRRTRCGDNDQPA